jgi:hypothetical protein
VELALGGVPPGDGALVAGAQAGVGVVGGDEGDAVAGLVGGGSGHDRGSSSPPGRCQAVRARVAARAMASMASAGLAASMTWQSVYVQMAA